MTSTYQETLKNLKRTLATGSLTHIVPASTTLDDALALAPPALPAIETLRCKKVLGMYLSGEMLLKREL